MSQETKDKAPEPTADEQTLVRRGKLEKLRGAGKAYPHGIHVKNTADEIFRKYGEVTDAAQLAAAGNFEVAGRIAFVRSFGKAAFFKIWDREGSVQIYVAKDKVDEESFLLSKDFDLGDIIRVEGILFRTKTGELSIEVKTLQLLSKCLHSPPEKFHGLSDVEERYRRRYLDLLSSEETRKTFMIRSQIVQGVRDYFVNKGFLEVETPMLHSLVSGATARPFKTHHNALDMSLVMRIAPELHLKRLVVGGFERVFEINRNFRNEGISTRHNPEFTMLEFYMAYATYNDLMDMTEELIAGLCQKIHGKTQISWMGHEIDLARGWKRISMEDAVATMSGYKGKLSDHDAMREYLKSQKVQLTGREGPGALLAHIFESEVDKKFIQPTFVTGYPVEISPLARRSDSRSPAGFDVTDRFEFFVGGYELANGFNELNDPDDQKSRFESQLAEKEAGNVEATDYDADYILALEYGLPPTAGEGIGIDRLAMLLTNSDSIRDVILFPLLRP